MATLSSPPQADDTHRYLEDVLGEESTPEPHSQLGVVIGIIAIVALAFWLGAYSQQHSTKPAPVGPFEGEGTGAQSTLVVHVVGQVHKPGVYNFPFDARVRDAVQRAGGPKAGADLNSINLAAWLEDGTQIVVPSKSAAAPPASVATDTPPLPSESTATLPEFAPPAPEENTLAAPEPQSTPLPRPRVLEKPSRKTAKATAPKSLPKVLPNVPRALTKSGEESQNASPEYLAKHQLNINTATAAQLELLPNVGPSLAQKIVDYRQQNGAFKSVDELDNVSGIGEKTLEKLRPLVTVG